MQRLDCICGKCEEESNYFVCEHCGCFTPWCRGADDEYPGFCDDCAVGAAERLRLRKWQDDRAKQEAK